MPRRSSTSFSQLLFPPPAVVHLWILRLLVPLGAYRGFVYTHGFNSDTVAEFVGLGHWTDREKPAFSMSKVRAELSRLHHEDERKLRNTMMPSRLSGNISRLSALVGLTANDRKILEFVVLLHSERLLDETAGWLGQLSTVKVFNVISVLLDIPEPEVRVALGPHGLLCRSGVVVMDRSGMNSLRDALNLLSMSFADHLVSSEADPITLLQETVHLSSPAVLALADYAHVQSSLDILGPYLKHALATRRKGVNIFLYGPPGTGKSQLARLMAGQMGCELFEVASEDMDGDPVSGERRLRSYRAAQSFFSRRKALILFDEVEDVFSDSMHTMGRRSSAQGRKAWINRTLEENPVPALWLSNDIDELDPAFVRRFDMVFSLPIPPRKQRERIIGKECADLLDDPVIRRMAETPDLAPAVVARAAAVARTIKDDVGKSQAARAMEQLVNSTLMAQHHEAFLESNKLMPADVYDASLVCSDADLRQLTEGLTRVRCGRLCLFGPPGTGKTAYGKWLAEQLDMPLLIRRASDLMSAWVGGNEKNIAEAFRHAERDGAVLLIDEVDSFLQDRRGAHRGWEVSMVNEMLTCMEQFDGLFIASTNLMDGLDPAALRRFDLKVRFDYLKRDQAAGLLSRYSKSLQLPAANADHLARLARLHMLTPGDFAAVSRQSRFRPVADVDALITALEGECSLKHQPRHAIGFV